jgi:hypothetical protein
MNRLYHARMMKFKGLLTQLQFQKREYYDDTSRVWNAVKQNALDYDGASQGADA